MYVTCQLFRLVYIKIINYIGSILANLNNTMQKKKHQKNPKKQKKQTNKKEKNPQHAMKKKHSPIQIETIYTRDYFLWWKDP